MAGHGVVLHAVAQLHKRLILDIRQDFRDGPVTLRPEEKAGIRPADGPAGDFFIDEPACDVCAFTQVCAELIHPVGALGIGGDHSLKGKDVCRRAVFIFNAVKRLTDFFAADDGVCLAAAGHIEALGNGGQLDAAGIGQRPGVENRCMFISVKIEIAVRFIRDQVCAVPVADLHHARELLFGEEHADRVLGRADQEHFGAAFFESVFQTVEIHIPAVFRVQQTVFNHNAVIDLNGFGERRIYGRLDDDGIARLCQRADQPGNADHDRGNPDDVLFFRSKSVTDCLPVNDSVVPAVLIQGVSKHRMGEPPLQCFYNRSGDSKIHICDAETDAFSGGIGVPAAAGGVPPVDHLIKIVVHG